MRDGGFPADTPASRDDRSSIRCFETQLAARQDRDAERAVVEAMVVEAAQREQVVQVGPAAVRSVP
jgi:hypothetical protein